MNIKLNIRPDTYITGRNLHRLDLTINGIPAPGATLSVDEIEELEVNLTDLLMQISQYRRSVQKEDL